MTNEETENVSVDTDGKSYRAKPQYFKKTLSHLRPATNAFARLSTSTQFWHVAETFHSLKGQERSRL